MATVDFDWDHAIALFFDRAVTDDTDNPGLTVTDIGEQRCAKGLHVLASDADVYINKAGHRRCRACIQISRAERNKKAEPQRPPVPNELSDVAPIVTQPVPSPRLVVEVDTEQLDQDIRAAEEVLLFHQQEMGHARQRYLDAAIDFEGSKAHLEELRRQREAIDVPLCRNGLHPMVAANSYINPRTGHRRCRACARQTEKWRR